MICWNQGKSVRRLAFYRALRLKSHHICRKGCSWNDAELTGGSVPWRIPVCKCELVN